MPLLRDFDSVLHTLRDLGYPLFPVEELVGQYTGVVEDILRDGTQVEVDMLSKLLPEQMKVFNDLEKRTKKLLQKQCGGKLSNPRGRSWRGE